jgi:MATE family multidrug resistance protein
VLHAQRSLGRAVERPESPFRELIALAWPIAAGMFSETLLGLVDTKLVGGLGASAIGGVGVATTLMYLNYSTVFGVMRAVKVRTAYATGEGRPADGVRYATSGALLGAVAGVIVWAIARDVSGLLALLRVDPRIAPYARDYLSAVTFGAPATCALAALINHRQAMGDARSQMIVGVGGNVVNVFLSYGMIYGHFGLPRIGVAGSGYGTAVSEWLELVAMIALHVRESRGARPAIAYGRAMREVLGIGIATGLHFGGEMLAFTAFTAVLGSIGGADMAAHQIALITIRTSFLPGIAVGEASCVLVGRALGARRLDLADRANRAALVTAVTFMAACGVVFGLFGENIARGFTSDPDVIRIATRLLIVAAFFQILDAFNVVLRGSLRGAADVRVTAILGIAIIWTCVPTAAFFLGKLAGWGALGGWCGFVAETIFATIIFGARWSRGAWRDQYAPPRAQVSRALATGR